jgi:hypothetical protein
MAAIVRSYNLQLSPEVVEILDPPNYREIKFPFFIQMDSDE